MNKQSNLGKGLLGTSSIVWMLGHILVLNSGGFVEELLDAARKQSKPRRFPWQQKTVRDRLNGYGADAADYARLQGDVLLRIVQQQSKPRRWPWQQKTIRDRLNERGGEWNEWAAAQSAILADAAASRRDELLDAARKQAKPRRFPWQQRTARDRVNERSAKLASLAAEHSAQLSALAAARRDAALQEVRRQAQPSRWPWQQKTIRDQVDARTDALSAAAAAQGAALADAAKQRAAVLTDAAQQRAATLTDAAKQQAATLSDAASKQAKPRRFPWQQKTAYDKYAEQRDALTQKASDTYDAALDQKDALLAAASDTYSAASDRKDALLTAARKQSKPRRFPWQQKTAYDKLVEQRDTLAQTASDKYDAATNRAKDLADRSSKAVRSGADAASSQAQSLTDSVPAALGAAGAATAAAAAALVDSAKNARDNVSSSAGSATSSIVDTAKSVGASISATAEDTADAVQSAVNRPVQAVSSGVKATKRTARWSRRVAQTALWAGLAGIVIGLLAAPETGAELRKQLLALVDKIQGNGTQI